MTDIEHAKKYAEESISLATSMYNPRAEKIAELACLYGLTYKNEQLTKAKEIIKELVEWANWQGSNCPNFKNIQDKAEQFLKDNEVEK
jgi:hypothetical protein